VDVMVFFFVPVKTLRFGARKRERERERGSFCEI